MHTILTGICKQWNIVNTLTASRALSVIPAVPLIYYEQHVALFWLIVFSAATDAEGYLARFTNTTTRLGRVFDPLADKLFVNTMLLAYTFTYMNVWIMLLFVVNIAYDIDNTSRRLREIIDSCGNRSGIVYENIPVTFVSKSKTFILFLLVITIFGNNVVTLPVYVIDLTITMSFFAVIMSWWQNRSSTIISWFS